MRTRTSKHHNGHYHCLQSCSGFWEHGGERSLAHTHGIVRLVPSTGSGGPETEQMKMQCPSKRLLGWSKSRGCFPLCPALIVLTALWYSPQQNLLAVLWQIISTFSPSSLPYLQNWSVYRCAASQWNRKSQKCSFWEALPFFLFFFFPFLAAFPSIFPRGHIKGYYVSDQTSMGRIFRNSHSLDGRNLLLGLK